MELHTHVILEQDADQETCNTLVIVVSVVVVEVLFINTISNRVI